jgi:hypothetical protein
MGTGRKRVSDAIEVMNMNDNRNRVERVLCRRVGCFHACACASASVANIAQDTEVLKP